MESVTDDGLRSELELLESMFPEEFHLERGGQFPEFCIKDELVKITLHISFPVGYPHVAPKMKLSGDTAQLLPFDELDNRAQEEIGEAMLLNIVQLFQEMCRSLKQGKSNQGLSSEGRKDKKQLQHQQTDGNVHTKRKVKQSKEKAGRNDGSSLEKKTPMKQATDVISRIIWDPDLPTEQFTVGYLDRFVGIIEKPFSAFSWEDIASVDYSTLAIPKHRIQYFKYRDQIVWDKTTQTDDVFGSRGSGKTIVDVISEYDSKQPRCNENDISQGRQDAHHSDSDDDVEIDGKGGEVLDRKKKYVNLYRATHFICIPITSPQIHAAAQDVQEALCYADPRLTDGCLAVSCLHVTLAMIRINTEKDLQLVKKLLDDLQLSFVSMFNPNSELYFEGVSHFRDRVLYTKPRRQSSLSSFAALLLQKLADKGISTPGNYSEFNPHVTLIKLSRPMCRQYDMMSIERSLYLPFVDKAFGRQHVERLHLCSIAAPKEDGFYQRLHTVENSITAVSPLIPRLIHRACDKAVLNKILSQEMSDSIVDGIDKQSANQRELFEHLATILLSIAGQPTLVILRGIPGSGKSTAARAIANGLDCICSADDYFETKQGYHYDKTKLIVAHTQCFLRCINLMESETPLVVVDNINQHQWVYSAYKLLASIVGYQVKILELSCPNHAVLGQYASRSVHRVPIETCAKMLKEWESDPMAVEITQGQVNDPDKLNEILLTQEFNTTDNSLNSEVVVFTAVFLTKESRDMLLRLVPPLHDIVVCDHMTMQFNPEPEEVNLNVIGNKVFLQVLGVANDSFIQAVVVEPLSESIASTNALSHITISHAPGVKPSYSNEMLQNRIEPLDPVNSDYVLGGIVGAKVSKGYRETSRCVTDRTELSAVLHQQWLNQKMWPQRIDIPTCQLFVFDFDGTLVESPDPAQGRREYKRLTGQDWPHAKFLGRPESLSDPFTVKAGPAMADFHCHCGRAGSLSFVLTARLASLETAVKTWLERYNIYPDRLIMKPDSSQAPSEFKMEVVKGLVSEFPMVRSIRLWDDSDDNLKVFQALSKQLPAISFTIIDSKLMTSSQKKTEVDHFLQQIGSLPHPAFLAATESAICFVSEVWQSVIKINTNDPTKLSLPFGSSQLGRFADVDVCLLAPNTLSHKDCVVQLEMALKDHGVTFTYISHSSRCPRLKAKCFFVATAPVELDVVFCLVPVSFLESLGSGLKPSLDDIAAVVAKSDKASHTALTGPLFLREILADVSKSGRLVLDFVCLIEMMCLILKANCLKGNAFHCIRTFHLLKLLQYFLQAEQDLSSFTLDELQIKFIEYCAAYSTAQWSRLFGEFVPSQYISQLSQFFMTTQKLVQPVITTEVLYRLATAREPVIHHSQVELTFSCPDSVHVWQLGILIEARLGSYIRLLLSSGIVVQPLYVKPTVISFMVEDTSQSLDTVKQIFVSFWDELVNFNKKAASILLLSMYSPSTKQTIVLFSHGGISSFTQMMEEFAQGQHGHSVHLPKALGKYERLQVHELANKLGLEHASQGEDKERHVVLMRKEGKQ